jgi:hypothetical protein
MKQSVFGGVLAVASAVACTVMLGGGVASASGGWTIQSTYAPPTAPKKDIALNEVSCSAASACVTFGRAGSGKFLSESWNGTKWTPLLTRYPNDGGQLQGVACSGAGACTAVGFGIIGTTGVSLIERWNGTSWQQQTAPTPSGGTEPSLDGVSCPGAGSCIAVGGYNTGTGEDTGATLAESWNGTTWSIQPTPSTGYSDSTMTSVSCLSSTDCVAVGRAGNSVTTPVALAERWNGTSWTIQKTPAVSGQSFLESVSCGAANSCIATGGILTSTGDVPLVEHWNGTSWVLQHFPSAKNEGFGQVSCPSATSCTAVGTTTNSSGVPVATAAHWNGTAWTLQHMAIPAGAIATVPSLAGLSCPSVSVCEAVGFFHVKAKVGMFKDKTLIEAN